MIDPIVDVRRVREAHAAMFNYDLDAMYQDIKRDETKSGLKYTSYPPRRIGPSKPQQSAGAAIPPTPAAQPARASTP